MNKRLFGIVKGHRGHIIDHTGRLYSDSEVADLLNTLYEENEQLKQRIKELQKESYGDIDGLIKWDTTPFLEQLSMMDISDMDTIQLKRFLQTHIDVKWDRKNNILKIFLRVSQQGVRDKIWENIPKQWRV